MGNITDERMMPAWRNNQGGLVQKLLAGRRGNDGLTYTAASRYVGHGAI